MNRNQHTTRTDQGLGGLRRRDQGSVKFELSVIVAVATIFAATAVLAVADLNSHAAAIGCHARREHVQVAALGSLPVDDRHDDRNNDQNNDHGRRIAVADVTTPPDLPPHDGAHSVVTPQETSSC